MRYLSVCSGIDAASVAWGDMFTCAALSEIEAFPRAVLTHHYPDVPLHGDFTTIGKDDYGTVDILVGGTPCQSFSVAGMRGGLDDDRGNLALEFCRLADRKKPRWVLWENVPGVLSSNGGKDFGSFLGALAECGYGFAYRVLDAQYVRVQSHPYAVPQRRRRVFVVGYLGDWRPHAAVLFERDSLRRNHPPRREARKEVAGTFSSRFKAGGGLGTDFELDGGVQPFHPVASALDTNPYADHASKESRLVAHSLRGEGFDASEDGTGRGTPIVACTLPASDGGVSSAMHPVIAFDCKAAGDTGFAIGDKSGTLRGTGHGGGHSAVAYQCQGSNVGPMGTLRPGNGNSSGGVPFIAFAQNQRDELRELTAAGALAAEPGMKQQSYVITGTDKTNRVAFETDVCGSIRTKPPGNQENSSTTVAAHGHMVRRLTPTECERLQGFPDGYTDIVYRGKRACDGPRYKALGNSMAVNVMRWLGLRIRDVDALTKKT